MRGIIEGFRPVDYVKKETKERVKGVTLALTYKSSEFFGRAVKEEFIGEKCPFYKDIEKYLSSDIDSLVGAKIFIDYNNINRGNFTYSEIADMEITPAEKKAVGA